MPSRSNSQLKNIERKYLTLARQLLPQLPKGDAEPCERPDFVVCTPKGPIGIEITRFGWSGKDAHLKHNHYRLIRPEDLQRVLNKKERCLRGYCVPGRAVWLIVVLDRRLKRCSGWITPELLRHIYQSSFGGVALLDFVLEKGWEIAVRESVLHPSPE